MKKFLCLLFSCFALSQSQIPYLDQQLLMMSVGGAGNGGDDLAIEVSRLIHRQSAAMGINIKKPYFKIVAGQYNLCPDHYKLLPHQQNLLSYDLCTWPVHYYPRYRALVIDKQKWLSLDRKEVTGHIQELIEYIQVVHQRMDCSDLDFSSEKDLLKDLKKTNYEDTFFCTKDDLVAMQSLKYFKRIFRVINKKLPKLAHEFTRKWSKLTYDQARFFGVSFNLCLNAFEQKCNGPSALVAKNFRFSKKSAAVLINSQRWWKLKEVDKYALVWHEVLGILGLESNDYTYSSMIDFKLDCQTVKTAKNSFEQNCEVLIEVHNPSSYRK